MTKDQLSQLGKTLWVIADSLSFLDPLIAAHMEMLEALTTPKSRADPETPPKFEAWG